MSKLLNKLTTGYWENKRFINHCYQNIGKALKGAKQYIGNTHRSFKEDGVYRNGKNELTIIIVNGFIIWLLMVGFSYVTGFWRFANPLLIVPYGIIPWYSLLYHKEIKKNV